MNVVALVAAATTLAGLLPPTPSPAPGGGVQVGKPAPTFIVTGLDGRLILRATPRGRGLFVSVFSTSCTPCRSEIRNIVAAYRRYGERVSFLAIDEREPPAKVARFVRGMHVQYQVGLDSGPLAVKLGASSLPHGVFVDGQGIVRAVSSGPLTREQLDRNLELIARPAD